MFVECALGAGQRHHCCAAYFCERLPGSLKLLWCVLQMLERLLVAREQKGSSYVGVVMP